MRIPFFLAACLGSAWLGCGTTASVDDLFEPTSGGTTGNRGGSGGITGGNSGTGGSGGATGGTSGGGSGGSVGGKGGVGVGGVGGTSGTAGTGGASGTGGTAGTTPDGGAGAPVDSGADVRRDAATDARDAGVSKSIRCGTSTCDPATQFCCLASANIRCVAIGGMCSASNDRLACDDTADCALGSYCCVTEGVSGNGAASACTPTACLAPRQMLCDPAVASPCLASGVTGAVCSVNGSSYIPDYAYCHVP